MLVSLGGWSLHAVEQVPPTQQHLTQNPFYFTLCLLRILWLDLPELITITEDQVHMLVKSLEGANEDLAILQDTSHPRVNVLQHLAALSQSHDCYSTKSNTYRKVLGSLRPKGRLFFFLLESATQVFQYCFNHLLVSQLRMPVSVPHGNPPQVLAAAVETTSGTGDTPGCSARLSFYV